MARKNKNKEKTVLNAFKGMGEGSLSRLATTVKVDVPAAIGQGGTALSRFAKTLDPFAASPEKRAARKLKKIAKEMGASSHAAALKPKRRRSRLPYVVFALVLALTFGGAWLYQSISLPKLGLGKYLDYQAWLDTVSGNKPPQTKKLSSSHAAPKKAVSKQTSKKVTKKTSKAAERKAVAKSSKKKASGAAVAKKPKKTAKEREWERKLTQLRKQSEKKYKRQTSAGR